MHLELIQNRELVGLESTQILTIPHFIIRTAIVLWAIMTTLLFRKYHVLEIKLLSLYTPLIFLVSP